MPFAACFRLAAALVLAGTVPALAHSSGDSSGVLSGFLHPLTGPDHVVAMVAVGLWGAVLGAPALWFLPVAFPLAMALAGAAGVAGVPLPGVETGIALSGVILGLAVLFRFRAPLWLALVLVGLFAIFHGHAHGTELPEAANPAGYALGFVVATGLLHLAGIAIGVAMRWPSGQVVVRAAGGLIAVAGAAFLTGLA